MLNISDRQSRGGSTGGGGGGIVPPTFGYNTQGCLTAVGNRCGHKKYLGMSPPPPPQHMLIQNPMYQTMCCLSDTCQAYKAQRISMPIRQAAHAYKTHVSERQHMLTKPNISDRLKMTNTSQKPNIQGKLTMRTDLKCQHITRA